MFVLVHWVETNQTSILDESFLMDKTMLGDSDKVGMITTWRFAEGTEAWLESLCCKGSGSEW